VPKFADKLQKLSAQMLRPYKIQNSVPKFADKLQKLSAQMLRPYRIQNSEF
jgi:hypothetical protein